MKINIKKASCAIIISIIVLVTFGIMGNALCRYRGKYHYYRDQANCAMSNVQYVLSCYGDPYIVDFKDIIKHPKVSIILPVYNKGWCVEAALRSLQRQTLKEIEIICVDDGSTDNSIAKIKNYQQHDTRIKLVENGKNRGLVYTRVHGIREATGDYIMFLDPDDLYATNDIVEVAYNKCVENDVDVVCFGGYISRKESLRPDAFCHGIDIEKIQHDKDLFFTNVSVTVWSKCAKRECWLATLDVITDDILNEYINYREDVLFSQVLSLCITKCICIPECGYFYNCNNQSLCSQQTMNFDCDLKHANDIFIAYSAILRSSPHMQDFLLKHFVYWINDHRIFAPYTDDQLQQLYDIYMQINFDDEHKAKLSKYLQDGMAEIRKLRDSDLQK